MNCSPVINFSSNKIAAIVVMALFALTSCLPTSTSRISTANSTEVPTSSTYAEPTYPMAGSFLQANGTQTQGNLAIPLTYTDSFLIRGLTLSQYVRTLPNTTKFCVVGKFNYTAGEDKFLIVSAKVKSYTDLIKKTTEYYLQLEPNSDTSNQNDCLTYNLTNSLYSSSTNPSSAFSLTQLCSTCSSSVMSTAIKLYFVNGEQVPTISLGTMTLSVSNDSGTSSGSCTTDSACVARGYSCCLDSQCATDGAVRSSALTLSGFLTAQEDVRVNPSHFVLYPQYYYVCQQSSSTTSGSNSGSSGGSSETADYEAQVRIMEYTQLYNCLNKVNGEFSYCTVKFEGASANIPGNFSPSSVGYNDDINFATLNSNYTGDYLNNIVKIIYGGQTLYELNTTALTGATFVSGSYNDNITTAQTVNVTSALPSTAKDDNLYITYKVDGSCEKSGTNLAKCTKTYIQGSSDTFSTKWHDSSKVFFLPSYADTTTSANIVVKIGGIVVPEDTTSWARASSPARIIFSSSYPLYQNQTIEITYFVNSSVSSLFASRDVAQAKVNSMCQCTSGSACNLTPSYSASGSLVNYDCVYPTTTTATPPANQTVFVSNRNVPHRYYDVNGVSYDTDYSSAPDQELTAFSYTNSDVTKPSNVSTYTGFNEIYGSFAKSGTYIAKPAKMVPVKKSTTYDIYTNSGAFAPCTTCGTDYYSALQKIFPQNLGGAGGGYTPDKYNNTRVNNSGVYRGDDLLFGRACFVPATMIPWTHNTAGTVQAQRQIRLAGQHFLFANGYQRDWYGFDYGAIIGSFDGVTWFAIGNQRRIKATTGKLYLAVNAYYGDTSIDSNFSITVSESVTGSTSSIPTMDSDSDGAECQKSHFCSTDNDCFRQLGFDYSCQSVSGLSTSVPQFDANAAETINPVTKTLSTILGGLNGQTKRCVYRGRGAPCLVDLNTASSATTFNGSSLIGTLTCSANNYCQAITTGNKFNDRIARFATTPLAQNTVSAAATDSDIVGLGARIMGRPFDYFGSKSIPLTSKASLDANLVAGVCVPGKDIGNSTTIYDLNSKVPSTRIETSDKIMGVGPTMSGTQNSKYLNACPATDATGTTMQSFALNLTDPLTSTFAVAQNLSSNLLNLALVTNQGIYSSTSGSKITSVGYQRNTCLRAPGASCFSDFECAPSATIAAKFKAVDLSAVLNGAEEKYWEEELVCGNSAFKYTSGTSLNPNYDPKNNVCCREFGKTMTVFTQTDSSAYKWCESNTIKVAGVNTSINTSDRYSRVHTGYDKMTCDPSQISSTKSFALSLAAPNATTRWTQILAQYKTLDAINQRTCCTQNWVRSFATENGAGHAFTKAKMQVLDKGVFKNISWNPQTSNIITDEAFACDTNNYANSSCEIRSLTPAEQDKYLTWAGSLELMGIPQVAVKTQSEIYQLVDENQNAVPAATLPLGVVKTGDSSQTLLMTPATPANADFIDTSGNYLYSAASYSKFDMSAGGIKKVFSENEFNCCIPSNQEVPSTTSASQCCTGNLANNTGVLRCCLPDFTDVTVYLNRYVSSEGRGLSDSAYDAATGYIKDAATVKSIVASKNLCCSGTAMTGVAISRLSIPIVGGGYKPADQLSTTLRFTYRTDEVDNNSETGSIGSIYDAGVKWNNHVYCVPSGFGQ